MRSTIHTRVVLLSIDQYMDMHQHFLSTPPQWKLYWIVNQKKRDDFVNKKQNPIYLPTTVIQTNLTFYAYIHWCAKDILDDAISDDAKLNFDFRNRLQNKTSIEFRKRKLNHTETDKRTQNTDDDVDDVGSSWSSVEVIEGDACWDASFRCQLVDASSICNV